MTRIAGSLPVRLLLAALVALIAYQSARTAVSDLSRQELESVMQQVQRPGGGEAPDLVERARALQDYPIRNAFADLRGDVYSLVRFDWIRQGRNGEPPVAADAATEEYLGALDRRPRDGYLWARYGLYLSSLDGSGNRRAALQAMDRAMALSPRDYNTMRVVADLGIRYWRHLDCEQRVTLVALLDRATAVDDRLLSQWITQLGQKPMTGYLKSLYMHYGFNPRWARASVAACQGTQL